MAEFTYQDLHIPAVVSDSGLELAIGLRLLGEALFDTTMELQGMTAGVREALQGSLEKARADAYHTNALVS